MKSRKINKKKRKMFKTTTTDTTDFGGSVEQGV